LFDIPYPYTWSAVSTYSKFCKLKVYYCCRTCQ